MEGSILKEVIDTYGENGATEVLDVLHFMLKKMEYTQRKKNDAKSFVEYLEQEWDIHPGYGYNPMRGGSK